MIILFSISSLRRMVKWKVSIVLAIVLSLLFLLLSYDYPLKQRIFALSKTSDDLLQITLVFIHIQKTAGSEFERAIVRRLNFANHSSCRCPVRWKANRTRIKLRCNCTRNGQPWLISRFSVGWLCGVHADWTTYHRCLPHKLDLEYGFYPRKYVNAKEKNHKRRSLFLFPIPRAKGSSFFPNRK